MRPIALLAAFVGGVAVGAGACLVLLDTTGTRDGAGPDAAAAGADAEAAAPDAEPHAVGAGAPGRALGAAPGAGAPGDVAPPRRRRAATARDDRGAAAAGGPPPIDGAVPPPIAVPFRVDPPAARQTESGTGEIVVELDEMNAAATQGLSRARAAAAQAMADGRIASDATLDALDASSDDGDRETAIGLALAADPPRIDRLLKIARDTKMGGSLRATALYAAAEAGGDGDPDVGAAVADLSVDADVLVRRTAIELFPRIGARGAASAIRILRAGDYPAELLAPLARAVAASDRALEFLLGPCDPEAAFAVIEAFAETEPVDAAAREGAVARLPDVVRPLLGSSEMTLHLGVFAACAAGGHATFLRGAATDASLPTSVRLAATDAALSDDACADGWPALVAGVLAEDRNPVELLRAVLARVPAEALGDPAVRASIAALAASHPNAWLREEARAKLQVAPTTAPDGVLRILGAVYGKDGATLDVTEALRTMVVGGRLVVEAGNDLAGDPLVGVVKDLAVTYVWKGERRTRTIHEYEVLTLP